MDDAEEGEVMRRRKSHMIQSAFILCFAAATILNFINISTMQKANRVVNYSGIVRGKSQRIVKLELVGEGNDEMLADIDRILEGLRFGGTAYELSVLKDETYQEKLETLAGMWTGVKADIASYRAENSEENKKTLVSSSEELFLQANETVYAAENFGSKLSRRMKTIQIFTLVIFITYVIVTFLQVLASIRQSARAKRQAETDMLTGLLNKKAFQEKVEQYLSGKHHDGLFLILDIDEFKQINDTYGHGAGDNAICFLAGKLRDVLKKEALIGRFGGDEFVAFVKGSPNVDMLQGALEILNLELKQHAEGETADVPFFTCSFGMTIAEPGEAFETIFSRGDEALYEAKESGRAKVCRR